MANKKETGKKGGFALAPITLSEPVKVTDGFTNLVESPAAKKEKTAEAKARRGTGDGDAATRKTKVKAEVAKTAEKTASSEPASSATEQSEQSIKRKDDQSGKSDLAPGEYALTEDELLRVLDADSLDDIYELNDVLRASSLKLYAALVRLADSRGRTRVKNHELMSKAGIKGIATLYKQERWLMDLKLIEKKAKPGPHDGSSYVVQKLEKLPLPAEIYEKFDEYLSALK
jgi:hypothetical protein